MKVRVNKAGKIYIALSIILGIAAVNTGNNLLYLVVSSLLSGMFLSGLLSLFNLKGLKLSVIPPEEVYAGKPADLKVVLRRSLPFPSFLIKVSLLGGEALFPIVGRDPASGRLRAVFPKRGPVRSVRVLVSSDFPFGMFTRFYEEEVEVNLVVFPTPLPSRERFWNDRGRKGENLRPSDSEGYEEFKDVREYRGEPLKLIHWKLSAKKEDLLVKQSLSLEHSQVILDLSKMSGELEEKLSRLSYLVNLYSDMGFSVGLRMGSKEIPPARGRKHRLKLLRELALFGYSETV